MRAGSKVNKVMIADDDYFIRKIIKTGLSGFAEFSEVSQGDEVMDKYKAEMPDILFLDIHLPFHNGIDLVKEVIDFDPEAYIIMISADSTVENFVAAKEHGMTGFLAKPINKRHLIGYFNKCPTILFQD